MTSIRKFAIACVVAAAAVQATPASAQDLPNQDTYFTFSGPVELPGVTLPAGRYLFQLVDSSSNRHVVRVLSGDRQKVFTTAMTIPSYSIVKPSDEPEIRFMEGPETGPHAVKLWIYPGRTVGHEFLYPRSQAARLARTSGEPVLTVKTEQPVSTPVDDADMTRIDGTGQDAAVTTDARAIEPDPDAQLGTVTAEEIEQTQPGPVPMPRDADAAPAPERVTEPAPGAERTELPRTATVLPLIALIGFGSLAAGAWMRFSRRSNVSTSNGR